MKDFEQYLPMGMLFLLRKKVQCRIRFSLGDEIVPSQLQTAVDTVLEKADYFTARLTWDRKGVTLEGGKRPYSVRQGSEQPDMPEETDGWLFAVSCQGDTVFFDWHHALSDGLGIFPFFSRILLCYCNLHYGTDFFVPPMESVPPYDAAEIVRTHRPEKEEKISPLTGLSVKEGKPRRLLMRIDRSDLIDTAQCYGVKPTVFLSWLFGCALHDCLQKEELSFLYPVDARAAVGRRNAPYNCVTTDRQVISFAEDRQVALQHLEEGMRNSRTATVCKRCLAAQLGWVEDVMAMKGSFRIKQRVFQMGEVAGGTEADFWLSYMGSPFGEFRNQLESFVRDCQLWIPPDCGSLGAEAVSLNGKIHLCIQENLNDPNLADRFCRIFAQEGIRVLSVENS